MLGFKLLSPKQKKQDKKTNSVKFIGENGVVYPIFYCISSELPPVVPQVPGLSRTLWHHCDITEGRDSWKGLCDTFDYMVVFSISKSFMIFFKIKEIYVHKRMLIISSWILKTD